MDNIPVEYINKTIYNITRNFKLKHQVKFGSKNQNDERINSLYISNYTSKQYKTDMELLSVNIDTNDYLILEYRENKDNNISIFISYPHLFSVKRILRNAVKWFYEEEYADMFIIKNDEIKFNSKYKDFVEETNSTINRKIIRIKPRLVEKDDHYEEGVVMNLDDAFLVELSIDELEALYDAINTFDLYQNSLLLTTYVLNAHPEELMTARVRTNRESYNKLGSSDVFKRKHKKKVKKDELPTEKSSKTKKQ